VILLEVATARQDIDMPCEEEAKQKLGVTWEAAVKSVVEAYSRDYPGFAPGQSYLNKRRILLGGENMMVYQHGYEVPHRVSFNPDGSLPVINLGFDRGDIEFISNSEVIRTAYDVQLTRPADKFAVASLSCVSM